jgi:hypothetical protein
VTSVQGWATKFTRQEVLPLKPVPVTKFLLVKIRRNEPEKVWKRGVTENDIELVVVCMAVKVFGSFELPVNPEIKGSGMAETVAEVVP